MDLICSDLHANLHALRAMMRFARRRGIQRFTLLGDLVGYGAHPNQVLERVMKLKPRIIIRGNHDRVCAGMGGVEDFNGPAKESAIWTHDRLRDDLRRFLVDLPQGPMQVGEDYVIAHGSPEDEDAYVLRRHEALAAFESFEGRLCFFGHTHLPGVHVLDEVAHTLEFVQLEAEEWFPLKPHCRYLANPGSLGQPRDRDRRLSFMTYDPRRKRLRLHRLDYDWDGAAKAILAEGLHPALAERLALGI